MTYICVLSYPQQLSFFLSTKLSWFTTYAQINRKKLQQRNKIKREIITKSKLKQHMTAG